MSPGSTGMTASGGSSALGLVLRVNVLQACRRVADLRRQSGLDATINQPLGAALHVLRMIRLGADAGDPGVGEELFNETLFMLREVIEDGFWCHSAGTLGLALPRRK